MPQIRSIQQILAGSPKMAIEMRGLERIAANLSVHASALAKFNKERPAALAHGDNEVNTMPEEANSWREFIKSTGLYPYYVNPSGQVVHTLDDNYKDAIVAGAVAVMPVNGTLVREAWSYEEIFWGLVSADRLTKFILDVANDARVSGCVAPTNCPGGMVSGTEKLGKAWAALGTKKMTVQHVDDLSASAAYWFGCQSRSVQLVGETADVGSVGVMLSFLDIIPLFEAWGAKYHEIYPAESEKKNEDWRALREQNDKGAYKESLSQTAQLFRQVVEEGRKGKLNTADENVLKGRVYSGSEAVKAGLADGMATLEECIKMVRTTTPAAGAPPAADPVTQIPPTTDDKDAKNNPTIPTMKLATRLAAMAAAIFSTKEEATAETIEAANKELLEKEITGVVFCNAEDATAAKTAAAEVKAAKDAQAAAESAKTAAETAKTAAETERDAAKTAQATAEKQVADGTTALDAAMKEHELAAQEGKTSLEVVLAAYTASKAKVAEQEKEIAKLKGEEAPSANPAGAVNKIGDTKEKDAAIAAADAEIAEFVK